MVACTCGDLPQTTYSVTSLVFAPVPQIPSCRGEVVHHLVVRNN